MSQRPIQASDVTGALGFTPTAGLASVNVQAAGNSQATATQLALARTFVTGGSGGVTLPSASSFGVQECPVANRSGATIIVYPNGNDQIEGQPAGSGIQLPNGVTARFSVDALGLLRYT